MKSFNSLIYMLLLVMLSACWGRPQNDNTIYVWGRYVVDDAEGYIPFEQKVKCNVTLTYYSQVSYGLSTYEHTFSYYSNPDGSFSIKKDNVGSNVVELYSHYSSGDTLLYLKDTIVVCRNGNPVENLVIPLQKIHVFNPTIVPQRFTHADTITFSINHDALTHIELGHFTARKEEVLWDSVVNNVQAVSFPIPSALQEERSFQVRYTTLHYGIYKTALFYMY